MNVNFENKKLIYIIWISFYILGLLFLLCGIGHESIWFDESCSYGLTNQSFTDIIKISSKDFHPPLYFIMSKIFRVLFGNSIIVLRILSVLGVLATALLGIGPVKKIFGKLCGLFYTFLIFIIPIFTSVGQDARMYSWACFYITAALLYGYLAVINKKYFYWILFGIFTVASSYTHNYAFIAVMFINLFIFIWILLKHRTKILPYLITALLSVLLYIPWGIYLINQLKTLARDFWIPALDFEIIIAAFVFPFGDKFLIQDSFILVLGMILSFIIIVIGFIISIIKKEKEIIFFIIGLGSYLLLVIFSIIFSLIFKPIFWPRYFFPMLGIFFLAVGYGLSRLKDNKTVFFVIFCFIILSTPQNIFVRKHRLNGPMKEAAIYVKLNKRVGDIFIHGDEHTFGTFSYYFPNNKHYLYLPTGFYGYCNYDTFKPIGITGNNVLDFVDNDNNIWVVNRVFASTNVFWIEIENEKYKRIGTTKRFKVPISRYRIKIDYLKNINN